MEYVALGKTNLLVSRVAFSAKSIEKIEEDSALKIIDAAFNGGINFFDCAHSHPQSEKILGKAIRTFKNDIFLCAKVAVFSAQEIRLCLDEMLSNLGAEKIDLFMIENPLQIPRRNLSDGIYETLEMLKNAKKILHIGISSEDFEIAKNVLSLNDKMWEVVAHPFNMLCSPDVENFVLDCAKNNLGFIAKSPLCGGILKNIPLALGFLRRFEDAVPLWSVRSLQELCQILYFTENPPKIDTQFNLESEKIREFFNQKKIDTTNK